MVLTEFYSSRERILPLFAAGLSVRRWFRALPNAPAFADPSYPPAEFSFFDQKNY
jgi:hypothetical protein